MGQSENANESTVSRQDRAGKYLTFYLAGEEYGIGITRIREIIGMMPITSVPGIPEYIKGVINLRGKVIPVFDLRLRFDMEAIPYGERTCIIVVETETDEKTVHIGVVVDSVSEVINIHDEDIEDTPEFGTKLSADYLLGMAKIEDQVKILLDINAVLAKSKVDELEQLGR